MERRSDMRSLFDTTTREGAWLDRKMSEAKTKSSKAMVAQIASVLLGQSGANADARVDLTKQGMNNSTLLQGTAMREGGEFDRTAMREEGADRRAAFERGRPRDVVGSDGTNYEVSNGEARAIKDAETGEPIRSGTKGGENDELYKMALEFIQTLPPEEQPAAEDRLMQSPLFGDKFGAGKVYEDASGNRARRKADGSYEDIN
jgi:hypothetical protein